KPMIVVLHDFGQRQIDVRLRHLRTRSHRCTEAGGRGMRALYSDDENLIAPGLIDRIATPPVEQYLVLDSDGSQFARPHSKKSRLAAGSRSAIENPKYAVFSLRVEQLHLCRVQILLPTLRAHRVSKERPILACLEAILPRLLLVGDAYRHCL